MALVKKCRHYGVCGGCSLRHLAYEKQVAFKQQLLADSLGRVRIKAVKPAVSSDYYRNRMDFVCGGKAGEAVIGLRQKGRFDLIVDIKECLIFSELGNRVLGFLREYINEHSIEPYDRTTQTGILRYFVMREGKHTDEFMLNVVTAECDENIISNLCKAVVEKLPQITTCLWSVRTNPSDDTKGDIKKVFFGEGVIREKIKGVRYSISPYAFFQTNTQGAEQLYGFIKRIITRKITGKRKNRVYDLFCGAGGIGLPLAGFARDVVGVELNFEALKNAAYNAEKSGIKNFMGICARAEKIARALPFKPSDIVIVDPPRAGIGKKLAEKLGKSKIKNLIYVSCNPKTLKIDLEVLLQYFNLKYIQPFDLFPHTPHIESVSLLYRGHRGQTSKLQTNR